MFPFPNLRRLEDCSHVTTVRVHRSETDAGKRCEIKHRLKVEVNDELRWNSFRNGDSVSCSRKH